METLKTSLTSPVNLSASSIITCRCFSRFSGLSPDISRIIEAYALIIVSGVFKSCETFASSSRWKSPLFFTSSRTVLSVSDKSASSLYSAFSKFTLKSPFAKRTAVDDSVLSPPESLCEALQEIIIATSSTSAPIIMKYQSKVFTPLWIIFIE